MNYFKTALLLAALTGFFLVAGYLLGGRSGLVLAFVAVALVVDFFAMSRQGAHRVTMGEAAGWSALWIAASLASEAKLKIQRMPEGLRRRSAGDVTFLINYNPHAVTFDGITIPGADVHWSRS